MHLVGVYYKNFRTVSNIKFQENTSNGGRAIHEDRHTTNRYDETNWKFSRFMRNRLSEFIYNICYILYNNSLLRLNNSRLTERVMEVHNSDATTI